MREMDLSAEMIRKIEEIYREMEEAGVVLPVIEAHCEYQRPARYDDEIEVRTEGTMLSAVRMQFKYTIVRAADGSVAAQGHTVHASVDPSGRPRRLPERIRQVFA